MAIKKSKKLKTVATAVFIAVAGICYTFLLPKENPEVKIVKGDNDLVSTRLTGTAVPTATPTAAAGETVGAGGGGGAGSMVSAGSGGTVEGGTQSGKSVQSGNGSGSSAADYGEGYGGYESGSGGENRAGSLGLVNINTADAAALMSLPGIGEVRAVSIIAYRTANGPFASVEDIMLVKGIKEGIFSKIKDRISTE